MTRHVTIVGGLVAVLAITTLTVAVLLHPEPLPGEIAYVGRLQGLGEPVPSIAELVRVTTGTEAALLLCVVPVAWLVVRHRRSGLGAAAIALSAMLVVQPVLKEIVDRPRPSASVVEVRATPTSKSFPSGHSLSTTTVWGAAALVARRRRPGLTAIAAGPIVLTFVAGGVQGVHWPSDAVAGTLIGAVAATAIAAQLGPAGTVRAEAVPPEEHGP